MLRSIFGTERPVQMKSLSWPGLVCKRFSQIRVRRGFGRLGAVDIDEYEFAIGCHGYLRNWLHLPQSAYADSSSRGGEENPA